MKYLLPTLVALALAITATSCKTNIDPTSLVGLWKFDSVHTKSDSVCQEANIANQLLSLSIASVVYEFCHIWTKDGKTGATYDDDDYSVSSISPDGMVLSSEDDPLEISVIDSDHIRVKADDGFTYVLQRVTSPDRRICDEMLTVSMYYQETDEVLKLFKDDPTLVNAITSHGWPMLSLAVSSKRERVVKYLLAHGAVPTLTDWAGMGNLEEVKKIVESGTHPDTIDVGFTSPLEMAAESGHVGVMRYLVGNGANILREVNVSNDVIVGGLKSQSVDVVKFFIEQGVHKAQLASLSKGVTLLHEAASLSENPEALKLIIEAVGNVNVQDSSGRTPLHLAAIVDNAVSIKLLLSLGADPSIKNDRGQTPGEFAKEFDSKEAAELLKAKPTVTR